MLIFRRGLFSKDDTITLVGLEIHSLKIQIVIDLPWTYKKIHSPEEPYLFSD